jgi:hypothetical protein
MREYISCVAAAAATTRRRRRIRRTRSTKMRQKDVW